MEMLLQLDGKILLWIQEYLRISVLSPVVIFITELGNGGRIWILLSLLLLVFKKTRKAGILGLAALLGSLVLNNWILKNIVGRTRPYEVVEGLRILIPKPGEFSFPSGHTASSFACAWIFFRELPKKYGIPALVLASLIGASRLYIGVHYPTDVLAGVVSGIAIACLVERIGEKMKRLRIGILFCFIFVLMGCSRSSQTDFTAVIAVKGSEVPEEVLEYAKECVEGYYLRDKESFPEYDYREWHIEHLEHCHTYADFEGMVLEVYQLNYEYLSDSPEKVVLVGGMTMTEEGWVMPDYPNAYYLIFEKKGEKLTPLGVMMENDCAPGDPTFDEDLRVTLEQKEK